MAGPRVKQKKKLGLAVLGTLYVVTLYYSGQAI